MRTSRAGRQLSPEEERSGRQPPFAALYYRDFRLFWSGQLVSLTGTQMQTAAVAWQVYLLTHSAVALGLIGLVRVLPIIVLSLWGGVVADALDRRRLLIVTQIVLLVLSGVLAAVTVAGVASVWLIYLVTAAAAATVSFDNPARQAVVPSLVPRASLTNALGLSATMWQAATVVGPSLAGIVIALRGVGAVYVLDALSFVAVIAALLVIRIPPLAGPAGSVSLAAVIEGLRFMRQAPILLSTMLLDFVATFFGSATALLPIFAADILHVGSRGYGFLYASPAVGAVAAGIAMSLYGARIHRQGMAILAAVAVYGAFTVVFGFSRVFALSLLALAGTGAADTVSMILRQTVRQLVTPDALRGRMGSVSMIFFMGGPQLGEVEAGIVARAAGAPFSVVLGGVAAIMATAWIAYRAVGLRGYTGERQ